MNVTYKDIKVNRCEAVIAYCDVTGFMAFMQRASAAQKDVVPFIQKMKFLLRQFRVETGFFCIPIGDGLIAVVLETDILPRANVLGLLEATLWLQKRMQHLIDHTAYPRPVGFRVRVVSGIIFRTDEPPVLGGPMVRTFDFIGDAMNLGARLCEVRREDVCVIHKSAIEKLSASEKKQLILTPVKTDGVPPRGVHPEDMKDLCTYAMRSNVGG